MINLSTTKGAFTVNEFLIWACIGRTKFYEELRNGNIKIRKLGAKTLILRKDAEAWLESLPEGGINGPS